MEFAWGVVFFVAIAVLLFRSIGDRKRIKGLSEELDKLRFSLSTDWQQRENAKKAMEGRLEALEAGGARQVAPPKEVAASETGAPPATVTVTTDPEPTPTPDTTPETSETPAETAPSAPPSEPLRPAAFQAASKPAPPPRPKINLEEWLGVKGAAVGGGIIACIAAVMLFQHAIDNEWISPALRVVMGTVAGIGAIGLAQTSKLRKYAVTANAMAGAGLVALYASFWAAHVLYDLISKYPAGGLMALVTAACCALAVRHGSIQIALLGLAGGFATPLLLSSGSDRPIELFGYLLLLDLAFLYLAVKKDWPILGALSLGGTLLFQMLWLGGRMGPDRLWLGVGILMVFAAVFAVVGDRAKGEAARTWNMTSAGALLFPLAFGMYFAARSELNAQPGPVLAMLVVITAGACWLGSRSKEQRLLPLGVAAGSLAVLGTYMLAGSSDNTMLMAAGVTTLLAAIHHGFAEWKKADLDVAWLRSAAVAAFGGSLVVLIGQYDSPFLAKEWSIGIAATVVMGAMLLRQASLLPKGAPLSSIGAGLVMAAAVAEGISHRRGGPHAPVGSYLAAVFGVGVALQFWAMKGASEGAKRWAEHAAGVFAVVSLLGLANAHVLGDLPPLVTALALPGMAVLIALVATRLNAGGWYLAASVLAAFGHSVLVSSRSPNVGGVEGPVLGILVATFAVLTWWPVLTTGRFRTGRWAWYGAALAGPMFFPASRTLFESLFGDGMTGVLAVGFAAVSVGALARAQSQWDADDPIRTSVLAWLGAAALFFISLAIPLQLERSWWTIGWALEGVAVLALWRKVDHPGLKYLAVGLFGAVSARLLLNPEVLTYYDRGSWRIVNWLAYTYLVPAAALVAGARFVGQLEKARARSWEAGLYKTPFSFSGLLGFWAVLVGFAWINLAVVDWFAEGYTLTVSLERMPARDLSFSISWAVYAVLLLAVGMAKRIKGLRYLSLGLLIITIGKVFLYDLGHLEDLYRVASLVGLAVSLFLVSLAYQRFVFTGAEPTPEPEPTPDSEPPPADGEETDQ
ncbi:MAG: DUF2339 domain-containing protein [Deltaproteobacteria bacterium]|nr:DUF2339 domain-containing protein [Deltaproteobacteria bacterium]